MIPRFRPNINIATFHIFLADNSIVLSPVKSALIHYSTIPIMPRKVERRRPRFGRLNIRLVNRSPRGEAGAEEVYCDVRLIMTPTLIIGILSDPLNLKFYVVEFL